MRYACIARHRGEYPLRLMCKVLEVSRSGYYASRRRAPSARMLADERLLLNVRVAFHESHGTYGAPRVHRDLREQDLRVGKKRVARLMQHDGLVARPRRAKVSTTDSSHALPIAPNVLDRQFTADGINRVWVSDITYIPTRVGKLYLAVVLDLASRRCVGWSLRESLETELVVSALEMALVERQPPTGLILHSDRGSQYASATVRGLLDAHGIVPSMSRLGNCWDNAVAESFFSTLEFELLARHDWQTPNEARLAIFRFIATWYNPRRRHSTLEYRSPVQYESEIAA